MIIKLGDTNKYRITFQLFYDMQICNHCACVAISPKFTGTCEYRGFAQSCMQSDNQSTQKHNALGRGNINKNTYVADTVFELTSP